MGYDIMGNDGDEGNDSLGSSFASSFSLPPPERKEVPDKDVNRDSSPGGTAAQDEAAGQDPKGHASKDVQDPSVQESPDAAIDVENVKADAKDDGVSAEENKKNLDDLLVEWRKESGSARKKAEDTRAKIEEERAAAVKATDNSKKEEKLREKQAKEEAELEKQIQAALSAPGPSNASSRAHAKSKAKQEEKEQRWADVRDAWEIVKDGKSLAEGAEVENEEMAEQGIKQVEEVETDGRGLVAGDEGGKESNTGLQMLADLQTATKAVTDHSKINPELAPDFEPRAGPAPSERIDKSDEKGAGQERDSVEKPQEDKVQSAGGNAGGRSASGSEDKEPSESGDKEAKPSSSSKFPSSLPAKLSKAQSANHFDNSQPNEFIPSPNPSSPSQPPSLTLSLFTSPSRRTVLRLTAVLGINLFLPFLNGVMLGFGEIFAKEAFGFGRRWWTGQVKWGDLMRGSAVAGLGLQQAALETLS